MAFIEINYTGDLRCAAHHGLSGAVIQTDAPSESDGKGEMFSPSDLLAASLATCILSSMALLARRLEVDMAGATARIDKEMSTSGPRRVVAMPLIITMPAGIPEDHRAKLEQAASSCPVAKSLHPDLRKTITVRWE